MGTLTLRLLGPFQAHVNRQTERLRLPTQKAGALLAYLALRDDPYVSRDSLAALLWGDVPLSQGRHSLSQELIHIRTALAPDADAYLSVDRHRVDLHLERIDVDADRLVHLVACRTSESMRDACSLYRGELLAGLHTRERAFDAWLEKTRGGLSRMAILAHEYHIEDLTRRGDTSEAQRVVRQLVAIDPANQFARRRLIAGYGGTGESLAAGPEHHVRAGAGNASAGAPRDVLRVRTRSAIGRTAVADPDGLER